MKIGMVVRLRSGGPAMTVVDRTYSPGRQSYDPWSRSYPGGQVVFVCQWMENHTDRADWVVKHDMFPEEALEEVK